MLAWIRLTLGLTSDEAAAIITACGTVIAAILLLIVALIPILVSIRRKTTAAATHAKEAADQVGNDHTTNMRVENDERHAETLRLLGELGSQMRTESRRNGRRFAHMDRRIDRMADRLEVVEDTVPRPLVRRKR